MKDYYANQWNHTTSHIFCGVDIPVAISLSLWLSPFLPPFLCAVSINTVVCMSVRDWGCLVPLPHCKGGRIGLLTECEWQWWRKRNWREGEEKGFGQSTEKKEKKGNEGEECRHDYWIGTRDTGEGHKVFSKSCTQPVFPSYPGPK